MGFGIKFAIILITCGLFLDVYLLLTRSEPELFSCHIGSLSIEIECQNGKLLNDNLKCFSDIYFISLDNNQNQKFKINKYNFKIDDLTKDLNCTISKNSIPEIYQDNNIPFGLFSLTFACACAFALGYHPELI